MNYNTTTVRIAVTDPVLLRTKELLADLGVDAELVGRIAEAHARDILATFTATADLPFDLSERWTPGERIKAHHHGGEATGGMVVRIERSLMVTDSVVVILDGEDAARGINSDVLSHETEPTAPGAEEDSENEAQPSVSDTVLLLLRSSEPDVKEGARLSELRSIATVVSNLVGSLSAFRLRILTRDELETVIASGMGGEHLVSPQQLTKVLTYVKEIH